jgi:hypothetical protein
MGTKPLLIDERRHEALRLRAKALHLSEDELVRRAIDAVLVESPAQAALPDHREAAAEFAQAARDIADARVGAEPYRFRRDEVYEEREAPPTRPPSRTTPCRTAASAGGTRT